MNEDMKPASLTFPTALLAEIDRRAKALDMTRSQYMRALARKDLEAQPADQLKLPLSHQPHAHAA